MQRDNAYLLDMLLSARNAVEFASPITYAELCGSRLHQNAILKSVEIVGEADLRRYKPAHTIHALRDLLPLV